MVDGLFILEKKSKALGVISQVLKYETFVSLSCEKINK